MQITATKAVLGLVSAGAIIAAIACLIIYLPSSNSEPDDPIPPWVDSKYHVGLGKADITAGLSQVNMMGYVQPAQTAEGLWFRTYARTFILKDTDTNKTMVFCSFDNGVPSQKVKNQVVENLLHKFPDGRYHDQNIALSATHTHSSQAGSYQYLAFLLSSLGYVDETFQAFVKGITESIILADQNIKPMKVYLAEGQVAEANVNRSPYAYSNNKIDAPATDDRMVQLNFVDASSNKLEGIFNWHAVHPTSMNATNKLINGDNKGLASQKMEKYFQEKYDNPNFIAAFCSTNLGDTSPNLDYGRCRTEGLFGSELDLPANISVPTEFTPGDSCTFETSECYEYDARSQEYKLVNTHQDL